MLSPDKQSIPSKTVDTKQTMPSLHCTAINESEETKTQTPQPSTASTATVTTVATNTATAATAANTAVQESKLFTHRFESKNDKSIGEVKCIHCGVSIKEFRSNNIYPKGCNRMNTRPLSQCVSLLL